MLIPIAYLVESACILVVSTSASISCRPMVITSSTVRSLDHFPHYGFGNIAEGSPRLPNVEKVFGGIRDAVLNHPFHQCGVQVTCHHLRFSLVVAGNLIRIGGVCGREPEFLLQLPFDGNRWSPHQRPAAA